MRIHSNIKNIILSVVVSLVVSTTAYCKTQFACSGKEQCIKAIKVCAAISGLHAGSKQCWSGLAHDTSNSGDAWSRAFTSECISGLNQQDAENDSEMFSAFDSAYQQSYNFGFVTAGCQMIQ